MEKDIVKTAQKFWKSRSKYPVFGSKERRAYEGEYLARTIPMMTGKKSFSVLDIGCGAGEQLAMLSQLLDLESIEGWDLSKKFVEIAKKTMPGCEFKVVDLESEAVVVPNVDVVILSGVIQYLSDEMLGLLLLRIAETPSEAPVLILKTSCPTGADESDVRPLQVFSESFKADYGAIYRPLHEVLKLVGKYYSVQEVRRAYPDELESKFNTMQWWIALKRK